MVRVRSLQLAGAGCALLLTWLSAFHCAAQHDARATVRSELAHVSASAAVTPMKLSPSPAVQTENDGGPWLWIAASTTAAFAASYAVTEGLHWKASHDRALARERSENFSLELDTRLRSGAQAAQADLRADLLNKVSDICLAGTVAATGATLLIWLTRKSRQVERQVRTLIGPMVLRGANGGGLVLREKF